MTIVLCNSNRMFLDKYTTILKDKEIELNLFLKNLQNKDEDITNKIRGGVYDENNNLRLLFLDANPFCLQLFGIDNNCEVTKSLVKYLFDHNIHIKGILGSSKDTDFFNKEYQYYYKKELIKGLSMDVLVCYKAEDVYVNGELRLATKEDLSLLKQGIINFEMECFGKIDNEQVIIQRINDGIDKKTFYIFINNKNEKTSFLRLFSRGQNGLTVSSVYTFKQYRGKGYAKAMINIVARNTLQKYKYISLYVDQKNPISNKVYFDNGFRKIIDNIEYYNQK